ncbi:MAG TPA: LytR C-terminal domain-containing protein, partial [Oculatellaceae cyanobacterium]
GRPENVQPLVRKLQEGGYRNIQIDNSWREPLSVTRIVAQQGDSSSADAIRDHLGLGEVRVEGTGSLNSDITIQLGKDWLQKQASSE